MASSPETAPSPPDSSKSSPPPSPDNSSPPPASPPPAPPESPPPAPPQSPPSSPPPAPPTSSPPPDPPNSSPPPASSPPSSNSSPPPSSNTPSNPSPPEQSQTPPPNNPTSPTQPTTPPSPSTPATPQPPPVPGSPPAPHSSPAPPGAIIPKSPPLAPGSSSTNGSSSSSGTTVSPSLPNSGGINTGIIAAIAFGGVAIVVLLVVCVICTRKKKKPQYYMDHGRPPKGGDQYYNGPGQWNNSPQPMEHIVKIPPPPGVMGTPAGGGGGGGWGAQPPPHMINTSSDMSPGYSTQPTPMPMQPLSPMGGMGSQSQFTYEELATATNGFSQTNLLGQGGFGYVHKGVLLDKREVAVKSLKTGSGQGEREFQAEVEIISRVHHRHLVSLVGYCIAGDQRMLVYEFVPNNTLEFHLHGKGQPVMDWATRLRIALGSAKGLAYLHEDCHPRIIHRDIKAANILLDSNCEAMVADFGLAKLTTDNFTHVSTRVMGTFGYLAPEYAASGKLTEKSDVFSFGVMLLELITGRRPVDPSNQTMEDSLVDWARPLMTKALEDGNYDALVDPLLEENYVPHELARMVASAAASIRHSARRRPKMSQIVRALEGAASLEDLNENVKSVQSVVQSSNTTTELYDTRAYDADMMKFRKMVLTSQDPNSSEYGATSEYGLNPSSSSSDVSAEIGKKSLDKQKI